VAIPFACCVGVILVWLPVSGTVKLPSPRTPIDTLSPYQGLLDILENRYLDLCQSHF